MMMMMSAPSTTFHDYLKTNGFSPKAESLSPIQIDEDDLEPSSFDNNNRNLNVKRPMNAFLLWARGERKRVSSDGGGVSQTSLSKLLGETWRHMSVGEKQPFLDTAESLKKQHHIDHPDYRFRPKRRSTTAAKTIAKKHHASTPQKKLSNMISSSSHSSTLPALFTQPLSVSNAAAPHPVQSTVLAMCQAIILESSNNNNDWFSKLIGQPHPVIVAPSPRTQTSPSSSRRAVRIQIINKHDDIILPPPSLLPMTPSPLSLPTIAIDESTQSLADYLASSCAMFTIPTNNQQGLAPVIDDSIGYETLHDSITNHFIDLDQPYNNNNNNNNSGWIDTPLSNFDTVMETMSTSPYTTYDYLCL